MSEIFYFKSVIVDFKYTILEEKIISDHYGFLFMVNEFMFDAFNRKIVQLVESGVADRIVNSYSVKLNKTEDKHGPVVLTLDHLGIWFIICLGFLTFAMISLVLELSVNFLTKAFKKF